MPAYARRTPPFQPRHHWPSRPTKDLAAASLGAPPNHVHGARERLASRCLPHDLRYLGWRILHVSLYSSVFLDCITRDVWRATCAARPLHVPLPEYTK